VSEPIPVAVLGAQGRMGRFACELLGRSPGFALAAAWDRGDAWERALAGSGARVVLDLTVAGLGFAHGMAILESGLRPVIGTSGVTPDESARLDRCARERTLGGIVVPNFSVGAWLLMRFSAEAARFFERAEVIELHHERKVDAPSGTAAETARRIADALPPAEALAPAAARGDLAHGVPIHSVRMGGLYAHQEVLLGRAGELLTLRHDMSGPEAFAPGILRAVAYASRAVGVARGIEAALA
jgi:4-hydroxy-tetrahydrodipicolinate reductase